MKLIPRIALALAIAATAVPLVSGTAFAQAMAGRALEERPRLSVSYYKTPPGKQDEWLAAYIKWHRPIMEYYITEGVVTSSTVYANSGHALAPAWDFMIINISPPPALGKKSAITRGELIKKLFPDLDAYTAGEKHRWELTESHWDQSVTEIDLTAKHPGVYYPILPDEDKPAGATK